MQRLIIAFCLLASAAATGLNDHPKPKRWAQPTADQGNGAGAAAAAIPPAASAVAQPAVAGTLARPIRATSSQASKSHSETSHSSSSVQQTRPVRDNHSPIAKQDSILKERVERSGRRNRSADHKSTGEAIEIPHDLREPRAAEIQENLRNQARHTRNSDTPHIRQQRHDPSDPATWHRAARGVLHSAEVEHGGH